MRAEEHFKDLLNASRTFSARQRMVLRIGSAASHRARACLRQLAFGSAATPQNTKRREPRPRLTATDRGEPSPRPKPDGLTRRRPATVSPSGRDAIASARKPRVARTRKRGKPRVEARKGFAASLEALTWLRRNGSRGGSARAGIRCGAWRTLSNGQFDRRRTVALLPRQRSFEAGAKRFRASTKG